MCRICPLYLLAKPALAVLGLARECKALPLLGRHRELRCHARESHVVAAAVQCCLLSLLHRLRLHTPPGCPEAAGHRPRCTASAVSSSFTDREGVIGSEGPQPLLTPSAASPNPQPVGRPCGLTASAALRSRPCAHGRAYRARRVSQALIDPPALSAI